MRTIRVLVCCVTLTLLWHMFYLKSFNYSKFKSSTSVLENLRIPHSKNRPWNDTTYYVNKSKINSNSRPKERHPFQFLENFKNPCWYAHLPTDKDQRQTPQRGMRSTIPLHHLLKKEYGKKQQQDKHAQILSCLPYFMLIGLMKCGTSDLFDRIGKHPDIARPPSKEIHWWSRDRFAKNINVTQYAHMFGVAAGVIKQRVENVNGTEYHPMITGEGTPTTFGDDDWKRYPENKHRTEPLRVSAHEIKKYIPNVKLILILRDPAMRLFSGYLYFYKGDKSADTFHRLTVHAVEKYKSCMSTHSMRYCLYDSVLERSVKVRIRFGMYSVLMKDWLQVFPRDQFFIVRTEDYSQDPVSTLRDIFRFLDLKPLSDVTLQSITKSAWLNTRKEAVRNIQPHSKTLKLLNDFYLPFKSELSAILNDTKFMWDAK